MIHRIPGDRDADEAVAVGRAVRRLVVEHVDVLGLEEARVVGEPDREEDGLVVDDRLDGPPLWLGLAAGVAPLALLPHALVAQVVAWDVVLVDRGNS